MVYSRQVGQYRGYHHRRWAALKLARIIGEATAKYGKKAVSDWMKQSKKPTRGRPKGSKNKTKKSTYVGRNQFTKHGLPSTYQQVSKPVYGNQYSAKGTMVKYKRKSPKVKSMRYKFNQGFRITQYLMNPKVSFVPATGQIKTRDSVILEGSKTNHYKLLVWNASPVVLPSLNKLGNQQQSVDQPWVFESEPDNSNLRRGYSDARANDPANPALWAQEQIGVSNNPAVITVSGIPYSGNSEKYVIPNMVQKAVNVNLQIELLGSLESTVEVFFKIVRRTKPMKPNPDLSDKGSSDITQAQLWEDVTKTICNNHITDKELYQTVYLYHKKYKPSTFSKGYKTLHIKKLVKTMYSRTSSYMHSDLVDRDNIGEAVLPNLDQHQDAIANQLFAVFGIRQLDDNKVQIIQRNISGTNNIKDMAMANKINILPTVQTDNKFKIRGYITSVFAARDIERNSTLHASSITDLHTRLTVLESASIQHDTADTLNLAGTWTNNIDSTTMTITAATTGQYDYTLYWSTDPSTSYNVKQDGQEMSIYGQAGVTFSSQLVIHPDGTLGAHSGKTWTKS